MTLYIPAGGSGGGGPETDPVATPLAQDAQASADAAAALAASASSDASAALSAVTPNPIFQMAHGFAVGDVVRLNGSTYVKAQSDSAANAEVFGMVASVPTSSMFVLATPGKAITGLSGLTSGEVYFLSPDTAGALTATEPTTVGQISKPVLIADSSSSGYVLGMRGIQVVADSGGGGGSTVAQYSLAEAASLLTPTAPSGGSYTVGTRFTVKEALDCTGAKFYWAGSARTIRIKLWDGSTALASKDVVVTDPGVYTGTFDDPVALTPYGTYIVSMWDTSGSEYTYVTTTLSPTPNRPFIDGNIIFGLMVFYGGDSRPTDLAGSTVGYPVDPIVG